METDEFRNSKLAHLAYSLYLKEHLNLQVIEGKIWIDDVQYSNSSLYDAIDKVDKSVSEGIGKSVRRWIVKPSIPELNTLRSVFRGFGKQQQLLAYDTFINGIQFYGPYLYLNCVEAVKSGHYQKTGFDEKDIGKHMLEHVQEIRVVLDSEDGSDGKLRASLASMLTLFSTYPESVAGRETTVLQDLMKIHGHSKSKKLRFHLGMGSMILGLMITCSVVVVLKKKKSESTNTYNYDNTISIWDNNISVASDSQVKNDSPMLQHSYLDSAEYWYRLARKQSRLEKQLVFYDRAIDHNPKFWRAMFEQGDAFYKLKRYDEAARLFRISMSNQDFGWEAHKLSAEVYYQIGAYEEAISEMDSIISKWPIQNESHVSKLLKDELIKHHLTKSRYLRALGRHKESLIECQRVKKLVCENKTILSRGDSVQIAQVYIEKSNIFIKQNYLDSAITYLQKLEPYPNQKLDSVYHLIASLYYDMAIASDVQGYKQRHLINSLEYCDKSIASLFNYHEMEKLDSIISLDSLFNELDVRRQFAKIDKEYDKLEALRTKLNLLGYIPRVVSVRNFRQTVNKELLKIK